MRTPVKLPGPMPTARASSSLASTPASRSSASTSSSTRTGVVVPSPRTVPSRTSALVAVDVAVSNASISTLDRDRSLVGATMPHVYAKAWHGQDAGAGFRPLDERNGVVEVGLESPIPHARPVGGRDRDATRAPCPRTGARSNSWGLSQAQSPEGAYAADERRLPRAELPGHGHDVARAHLVAEPSRNGLRLRR